MSEMIGRPLAVVTGASSGIGRVLPETAKAATQARMTEPDRGQPDRGQPDPDQ